MGHLELDALLVCIQQGKENLQYGRDRRYSWFGDPIGH